MGEAEGSHVIFSLLVFAMEMEGRCLYVGFLSLPAEDCCLLRLFQQSRILALVTACARVHVRMLFECVCVCVHTSVAPCAPLLQNCHHLRDGF